MNALEEQLLRETIGATQPRHSVRTRTKIDAGRWWRRVPVWLCLTADEFVLVAVGRRQYVDRIAIADCPETHYNHATGELVLEPAESLQYPRLKMPPTQALDILKLLESQNAKLTT